jgi:preprotein translocase subunit SecG
MQRVAVGVSRLVVRLASAGSTSSSTGPQSGRASGSNNALLQHTAATMPLHVLACIVYSYASSEQAEAAAGALKELGLPA